jgi:hypothetical protein
VLATDNRSCGGGSAGKDKGPIHGSSRGCRQQRWWWWRLRRSIAPPTDVYRWLQATAAAVAARAPFKGVSVLARDNNDDDDDDEYDYDDHYLAARAGTFSSTSDGSTATVSTNYSTHLERASAGLVKNTNTPEKNRQLTLFLTTHISLFFSPACCIYHIRPGRPSRTLLKLVAPRLVCCRIGQMEAVGLDTCLPASGKKSFTKFRPRVFTVGYRQQRLRWRRHRQGQGQ